MEILWEKSPDGSATRMFLLQILKIEKKKQTLQIGRMAESPASKPLTVMSQQKYLTDCLIM